MIMDSMELTFSRLEQRILGTVERTDMTALSAALDAIEGPALICGCGGSSVVAAFMEQVLREKNCIACARAEARDLLHMNTSGWKDVIAVSYGGSNAGVRAAFSSKLRKHLFSAGVREDASPLVYAPYERENSYISVSATLAPMAVLLMYHTDNDVSLLKDILSSPAPERELDPETGICEIYSGEESGAAAVMLESTLAESGMCAPVVHDKYNFCHGRINLSCSMDTQAVYFSDRYELDGLMKNVNLPRYRSAVVLERRYEDDTANDFWLCLQCIRLCRSLAVRKGVDLSSIKEHPDNDRFYLFGGEM